MSKTFIYCIVCPITNTPKYIGKSDNPYMRLYHHCHSSRKSKVADYVRSLLRKGLFPILEIVDEVDLRTWEFWEQHYISLYRSWGFELKNMTIGGDGRQGGARLSEEHKKKIRMSCRELGKGIPKTHNHRLNLSLAKRGVPAPIKQRLAVSRAVVKIAETGEILQKYTSMREAQRLNGTGVSFHVQGKIKNPFLKGFTFIFEDTLTEQSLKP